MNNNAKKSLINEAFNQSDFSNTLKEQINDNSKILLMNEIINSWFFQYFERTSY